MKKEFVGFIIENGRHKRASFILDTDNKTLACQKVGFFSGVLASGALGALLSSGIEELKKKNIVIYDISNIINVEFFKFGLTTKAIQITTNTEEIKFLSECPKDTFSLLEEIK